MKITHQQKAIAIGTALGAGIGTALNNLPLGIGIGIVFSVAFMKKNEPKDS